MATTTVSEWFPGMTPAEGQRRGPRRISLPRYDKGDRITLKHNDARATVVSLEPMLHTHRTSDWMYYVREDGGEEYPTLDTNIRPLK